MRTVVRFNPNQARSLNPAWSEFDREFKGLFNWALGEPNAEGNVTPATDLVEEKDRYRLAIDLPGLKKEEIEVSFQDGVLTVRGERNSKIEKAEDGRVVRQERMVGSFERRFRFSEKIDSSAMSAKFEDGVLRLEVPFLPEAQPQRLEIQ